MSNKEKVASREQIHLVENGHKTDVYAVHYILGDIYWDPQKEMFYGIFSMESR